ncbi:GntR family transcriptional regulator [Planosporangium flavigriseum]|uniref:GntR family transcriptional regulator n=1 Tax=Planosporangium flavigriseum TaxID=373681 RepID=A0A8J3M490_9ACTN|nr:GntR family transcriptional regulator [Planosporangium flavigriseum]NJC68030.1 GntR family transcriptional regulator [Planosporangium flavigriseum]GIG76665.1 GntR family transcriptional regulator [Planosporangium flavigriseum]
MRAARRLTLTDDVYGAIKSLIMDHLIAPGERVTIDALARELSVSPTPIREALARLESEGLVRKRAMAGYSTAPLLTRDQFEELFEMRLLLECPAAARAAVRHAAGNVDVDALAQEAELPDRLSGDGYAGHAAFTARDAVFHERVAEASGNSMLSATFVRLHAHLHLHRLHFPTAHLGISTREHRRIVAAIASGSAEAASEAMRAHLEAARDRHRHAFAMVDA